MLQQTTTLQTQHQTDVLVLVAQDNVNYKLAVTQRKERVRDRITQQQKDNPLQCILLKSPPRASLTASVLERVGDYLVERVLRVAMMIDGRPCVRGLHAHIGLAQRGQHGFGDGAVLVLGRVQVDEGDVRPVVGQQ